MSVRLHDLFCGAGFSTDGAVQAGAEVVVGANHWPVACESYGTNHPGARVDCADVCTVDPRRYPKAELLLASPECTHHSYARGRKKDDPNLFDPHGDQAAERSRATMWDVVRFTEFHQYEAVIVENVPAATKWGGMQGQKLRHDQYGVLFSSWLYAMDGLGYEHEVVHLNSMMVGVPQSRDRIYVVFWKKGAKRPDLDIRPVCWCSACGKLTRGRQRWKKPGSVRGNYEASYVYACAECDRRVAPVITPAAAAIDWTLPATRIGDRDKPLRPATMARIRRGIDKLADRPNVVHLDQLLSGGPDVDPDGLVVEVGGQTFERPGYARAWGTDEPFKTQHASTSRGLVVPTTHGGGGDRARTVDGVMPAQTGRQEQALVVSNMSGNVPKLASSAPTGTVTTGSKLALVYAGRESGVPRDATGEPMQTQTAINSLYLVEGVAQVDLRNHNAPRLIEEPLSTVAAGGQHHGLAYVVSNYSPGWMRPADERELGTLTTTDSHALLTYRGSGDVRAIAEPSSTLSTVAEHALLTPEIAVEDCLFRMLEPHELQAASGARPDYVLAGNKRDRVAQIGNAVTPPASRELVKRVMEAISG